MYCCQHHPILTDNSKILAKILFGPRPENKKQEILSSPPAYYEHQDPPLINQSHLGTFEQHLPKVNPVF